eukprot:NODE_374_length_895_cov_463.748698_g366_i0.p2 GENE.NODE_374_length_895_cov_463.748698_g366_i0~~NODE_374_length_895_cov_463.748698_g366_i0.p2  ORF type:complete len:60 (-),score=5.20 NODE_374_length_895_cov_463.748698_g366_i0:104-283(-)
MMMISSDNHWLHLSPRRIPPLYIAAEKGHTDIVNFLTQDCGVNPNETHPCRAVMSGLPV